MSIHIIEKMKSLRNRYVLLLRKTKVMILLIRILMTPRKPPQNPMYHLYPFPN